MKRLIKTVDLRFFRDSANGEHGLTHHNTQDENYGDSFNAFWNGIGIFHDVFEHSHEYENKYFRGDYAMNVGGEMAAMGAMWYYFEQLGVNNRMSYGRWMSPGDSMKRTTLDMVLEAIQEGYTNFGHTLESNVPKQRPVENSELEYQIEDYWKKVKEQQTTTTYEQEKETGEGYKKSVSFRKIADLHRYGFRMAGKLVPDSWDNARVLEDFIKVWDTFCQRIQAQDMENQCKGMTFKLYKDENGLIEWKVVINAINSFEFTDVVLTAKNIQYFSLEDMWQISDEN